MKLAFIPDTLQKAMVAYPIGTVKVWGGVRYKKISQGKWRPTSDQPGVPRVGVGSQSRFKRTEKGRRSLRDVMYEKKEFEVEVKPETEIPLTTRSALVLNVENTEPVLEKRTGWFPVPGSFVPTGVNIPPKRKAGDIFETPSGVKYKVVQRNWIDTESGQEKSSLGWEVQSQFDPKKNSLRVNELSEGDLKLLKEDAVYQQQFIKANQAFVGSASRRVHKSLQKIEYADILQAGNEGFMKAIREMDLTQTRPETFLSFARKVITNKMKDTVKQAIELLNREPESLSQVVGDETMARIDAIAEGRADRETGYLRDFQDKISEASNALQIELTAPSEADAPIYQLLDRGYTATKVGKELGIPASKVRTARNRREKNQQQARQAGKVFKLLVEGHSPAEISRQLNISKPGIKKIIETKIAPIAEKYLMKSLYGQSFIKFLVEILAGPKLVMKSETKR